MSLKNTVRFFLFGYGTLFFYLGTVQRTIAVYISISSINKGAETKYRDGPMKIQYDRPSKYRMRKRTFKGSIPSQKKT